MSSLILVLVIVQAKLALPAGNSKVQNKESHTTDKDASLCSDVKLSRKSTEPASLTGSTEVQSMKCNAPDGVSSYGSDVNKLIVKNRPAGMSGIFEKLNVKCRVTDDSTSRCSVAKQPRSGYVSPLPTENVVGSTKNVTANTLAAPNHCSTKYRNSEVTQKLSAKYGEFAHFFIDIIGLLAMELLSPIILMLLKYLGGDLSPRVPHS